MSTVGISTNAKLAEESDAWACLKPLPKPDLKDAEIVIRDNLTKKLASKYDGDSVAKEFLTDATILRYLWAHQFDEDKAFKSLENTVEWRRGYIRPDLHCKMCVKDEQSHCFVRVGLDKYRRPIIYACPARARDSVGPTCIAHLVAEMEHTFKEEGIAENLVWIGDMRGLSMFGGGISVSLAKEFVSVFTPHFPERLGVMLMVDPPSVVEWMYGAVKPFMDPTTVRKNIVVKAKHIHDMVNSIASSEEQARWLISMLTSEPKPGPLPPLPTGSPVPVHRWMPNSPLVTSPVLSSHTAAAVEAAPIATGE